VLHHVSFSVHDPARASSVAAELLGARAVKAPSPPFPDGSWFVVMGDGVGSLIELTPWGSVLDPDRPGIASDPQMRPHSASHVLAGTPLATAEIFALAERENLRAQAVSAGLFQFVKVWIEDSLLLELLPPENIRDYVECFGETGASSLDDRLRALERNIAMSVGKA
jgi:catechol 2,3-dioxygenase-like lactoylglutathione lyase family enzyme